MSNSKTYVLFAIITVICGLGSLTQTVTNSMLLGIQATFGTSEAVSQWLTTIYMLTIGVTVPLVVHLSQRYSVRALVMSSIVIFLVGSVIDWLSWDFLVLFVGRILQAVATGIVLPLSQTVAMTRFPKGKNATAMGIAGIAMGFAPNIGPLVGGAFVDSLGWRAFFLTLSIVCAALLVFSIFAIAREDAPKADSHLDVVSFVLSTIGFTGLLLGFTNAASMDLLSALVWLPIIIGAVCLAWFILRQTKIAHPLIDMRIFASSIYVRSFIAQNCLFASFMGITLIAPLFVQNVCGMTAIDAGIVFIPATIFAAIVNPLAGILSDKLGSRPILIAGSAFLVCGSIWMCFVNADTPLWLITLMQTVRGIGVSSLIGPLISWGMSDLPFDVMMDGSAFFTTVRQACASFGTALMMLLISGLALFSTDSAFPYEMAFALSAAFALGVLVISIGFTKTDR